MTILFAITARMTSAAVLGADGSTAINILDVLTGRFTTVVVIPAAILSVALWAPVYAHSARILRYGPSRVRRAVAAHTPERVLAMALMPVVALIAVSVNSRPGAERTASGGELGGELAVALDFAPAVVVALQIAQLLLFVWLVHYVVAASGTIEPRGTLLVVSVVGISGWIVCSEVLATGSFTVMSVRTFTSFVNGWIVDGVPGTRLVVLALLVVALTAFPRRGRWVIAR